MDDNKMIHNDLLSVIVPVYNLQDLIERTIQCLLDQTYKKLEIIVVDDGSTDKTPDILDAIAVRHEQIVIIHQSNKGVMAARLAGIKAASGDWIGFMDGDDVIEDDMYERLMENAFCYGADISHCGYQMVFPNRVDYYYNTGKRVVQSKEEGINALLSGEYIEPSIVNKVYSKRVMQDLLKTDIMNQPIKELEDLLLNYFLFKAAKNSVYEDVCPYHYIVREGSATTSKYREYKYDDPINVFNIILRDAKDNAEITHIVNGRLIGLYIGQATMPIRNHKEMLGWRRKRARQELRKMLPIAILESYSRGLIIKAIMAALMPNIYQALHGLYGMLTGSAHKYDI